MVIGTDCIGIFINPTTIRSRLRRPLKPLDHHDGEYSGQTIILRKAYKDGWSEDHIGVDLHGRVVRVSYWDGPARTGGKSIILGNATTDGWSEYHIEVSLHGRVVSVSHWGGPTWTGGQRIILGWAYMDEWSEYHKLKEMD